MLLPDGLISNTCKPRVGCRYYKSVPDGNLARFKLIIGDPGKIVAPSNMEVN
jgi:hypothetical protein